MTWGDYAVFSSDYGTMRCRSDYTADGLVNLADLALVNLHVVHPALKVSYPLDGVLDFGELEQGVTDSQTLRLQNWGGGEGSISDVIWQLVEDRSWITLSPASGTIPPPTQYPPTPSQTQQVQVEVNTTGLEAGAYTYKMALNSNSPYEYLAPDSITVTMTVTAPVTGVDDRIARLEPRNYPNPFGLQTAIRYAVPEGGAAVRVTVHDLQGRVVRTLVSGEQWAGEQSVVWDGRDDRGLLLGSGVYLYRVTVGENQVTRKMILLR
jgi:hypothetical protein